MKNSLLQKVMAIIVLICVVMGVLPAGLASADDYKPGTPTIKVKLVNGTDAKITIGKTPGVDFYEVWVTSDCGYMGYKNENYFHPYKYNDDNHGNYINAAKVEKDGTAVRSVTVKNLTKGKVSVKVRGVKYRYHSDGSGSLDDSDDWYYGDFSKAKTVTVKSSKTGYKTSYNFSKAKKGDIIKFGSYEQDYPVNGKDPVEWIVLDKKKDGILVMSKYALDCLPYNTELADTTWAECTLREWLNKKFYNAAFNSVEKKMIKTESVKNEDNPYYDGNEGGKDTKDKVFLLSLSEIVNTKYGFDSDIYAYRRCAPTDYAVAQGADQYSGSGTDHYTADDIGTCWWWLRSPGASNVSAAGVYNFGDVDVFGPRVDSSFDAVRPVMFISLASEDDNKPGTPTIKVKMVNDTDVKVTIGKTSNVDFYEVWVTSDCGYMGYKNQNYYHPYYYNDDNPGNYINAAKVEKDGTAVCSVTVKNPTKGKVSVKVRGVKYKYFSNGSMDNDTRDWYYGDFSKAKTVTVKSSKTGYKTSYNFSKAKKGDIIKFGSYEQDYPINGKDPIEWVVLDKKKDGILVMSKYALDCLPYNTEYVDTTWAECTLREWLNKKFYNAAFNSVEKKMIRTAAVKNEDNPYYGTEGGKDTKDKVFLLSLSEIDNTKYGFDFDASAWDIDRRCAPTDYAVAQGAYQYSGSYTDHYTADDIGACWWWLRSPGTYGGSAAGVSQSGHVLDRGGYVSGNVDNGNDAVRPVLFIYLES